MGEQPAAPRRHAPRDDALGTTGPTHVFRIRGPEKDPWRANAFWPSMHDCGESQINTAFRTDARKIEHES